MTIDDDQATTRRAGDLAERLLCRTVGCSSLLSRRWRWPQRLICTPLTLWRTRRAGSQDGAPATYVPVTDAKGEEQP